MVKKRKKKKVHTIFLDKKKKNQDKAQVTLFVGGRFKLLQELQRVTQMHGLV